MIIRGGGKRKKKGGNNNKWQAYDPTLQDVDYNKLFYK